MAEKKDIIIDIQISEEEAMKQAVAFRLELDRLKEEQRKLNEERKEGIITDEQYARAILKNQQAQKQARASMNAFAKEAMNSRGSLEQMRGELARLVKQYDQLSAAERGGEQGGALTRQIADLTSQLKEAEGATGRFQRSVGNYPSAFDASAESISRFGEILSKVLGPLGMGGAAKVVQGFGKALTTLGGNAKESGKEVTGTVTDMAGATSNLGDQVKSADTVVQGFGKELYQTGTAAKAAAAGEEVAASASKTLASGIGSVAKQLLSLLANPIVAAIAALAVVVMKVAQAFRQNDDAMTNLNKAFAAFRPVLDIVNRGFAILADVVGKVVGGIASFVGKIASAIPVVRDYAAANLELVDAQEALRDMSIEVNETVAQNEAEIAELRAKSGEKNKYTVEERRKFLEEALRLEKENYAARRDYAEAELDAAEREVMQQYHLRGRYIELTEEQKNKISDEDKKRLSDLRVNLINTEKELSDGTRRIRKTLDSFDSEQKQDAKQAASDAKERRKNERAALRDLEDAYIAAISDVEAKALSAVRTAGERRIADLRARLKEEGNLTAKAKKAINDRIILEEARLQLQLSEIREKSEQAANSKRLEDAKKYYSNLMATLGDGEAKVAVSIEISRLEAQAVKDSLYAEADALKKMAEEAAADIAAGMDADVIAQKWGDAFTANAIDTAKGAYNALLDLQRQYNDRYLAAKTAADNNAALIDKAQMQREVKLRAEGANAIEAIASKNADLIAQIEEEKLLQKFRYNEVEKAKIAEEAARRRVKSAEDAAAKISAYSKEEAVALYGSIGAWEVAVNEAQLSVVKGQGDVLAATEATNAALREQQKKTIDSATAIGGAFATIAGGMSSLFSQAAEDNEEFADYATAMALMEILVSTAVSIANAIQGATAAAAATGPGAPIATPAFIAEMVGIVAGAMVSATSTLMQARQSRPSAPKFAGGGWVEGRGTDTSDNIPAWLSPGEFIVKAPAARANASLLEHINKGGGGSGNRYADGGWVKPAGMDAARESENIARAFEQAIGKIHPVVSVLEITREQQKVRVKERIGNW